MLLLQLMRLMLLKKSNEMCSQHAVASADIAKSGNVSRLSRDIGWPSGNRCSHGGVRSHGDGSGHVDRGCDRAASINSARHSMAEPILQPSAP